MLSRTDQIYREACKRSHRILANYLMLQAWTKEADCVLVRKDGLFYFLGIDRMRQGRLKWLEEDIKDLFPYVEALNCHGGGHMSTYFSRFPFPDGVFDKIMHDNNRLETLKQLNVRASEVELPSEEKMIAVLASLAVGVGAFTSG